MSGRAVGRDPRSALAVVARLLAVAAIVVWVGAAPASAQTEHRLHLYGESDANRQVSLTISWVPDQRATEAVAPPAPGDFTVLEFEDVVEDAEVVRLPDEELEVVLVLETRRDEEDFGRLIGAVPELVAGLPPTAKVAVVTAGDRPELVDEMAPVEGWSAAEALDGITRSEGSSVLEAVGLAADQFSGEGGKTPVSSRRRAVVVFAEKYQSDPTTVADETSERFEDEHIDTYVIGTARGYASASSAFPLWLGAGRRLAEYGPGLPNGAREIADQLGNQYRATFTAQAPKGAVKYTVRIGDESSPLNAFTLFRVPAGPAGTERGAPRLAVLVGVPLLIGAIVALLFVPPRIRAARARRSGAASVGVLQPVGTDGWPEPVVTSPVGLPSRPGPAPETVSSRPMGVGGEQVEGLDAVRELLRAGRRAVRGVWVAEGVHDPLLVELADLAHVPIRRVGVAEFRAAVQSEYSGGVLALTSSIPSTPIEQLCRPTGRPVSLVVVYGPADPERLAGLARASAASGFSGVVLAHARTAPVSPAATALARGAMEHVRFSLVNNLPSSIARLKRLGCVTIAIDPGAGTQLGELPVDLSEVPVALVVGAGGGLDRRLRGRCDLAANISTASGAAPSVAAIAPLACAQLMALRTERSAAQADPRP